MTQATLEPKWPKFFEAVERFFNDPHDIESFRQAILSAEPWTLLQNHSSFRERVLTSFEQALQADLERGELFTLNLWSPLDQTHPLSLYIPPLAKEKIDPIVHQVSHRPDNYKYLNEFILQKKGARPLVYVRLDLGCPVPELPESIQKIEHTTPSAFKAFLQSIGIDHSNANAEKLHNLYTLLHMSLPAIKAVLLIPASAPYDIATGGVLIFLNAGFDQVRWNNIWQWWSAISLLQRNITSLIDKEIQRRHALRAAVAAIMGRNMSHNIGSHAIWYVREQVKKRTEFQGNEGNEISQFLGYLQQRMDFLAQISTTSPSWCSPVRVNELQDRIALQKRLLDNIARSELGKGNAPQVKILFNRSPVSSKYLETVELPHGAIGVQALATIVENLIRNAAKHGDPASLHRIHNGQANLQLFIDIRQPTANTSARWLSEFYEVTIRDNLPSAQKTIDDLNLHLKEEIMDFTRLSPRPAHWGIKEIKICAGYLRLVKSEQIDEKYSEWKSSKAVPPLIEAKLSEREDETGWTGSDNLTYVFYLLRPKQALLIGKAFQEVACDEKAIDSLANQGVDCEPTFTCLVARLEAGEAFRHQFLVLDTAAEGFDWKRLSEFRDCLPPRIVLMGDNPPRGENHLLRRMMHWKSHDIKPLIAYPPKLVNRLWETWVQDCWPDFKLGVLGSDRDLITEIPPDKILSYPERHRLLVYQHGGFLDHNNPLFEPAAFHECFAGGQPMYHLLTLTNEEWLKWRVKEAAAVSIGIVDERIYGEKDQEAREGVKGYTKSHSLEQAWRKRRVLLLKVEDALDDFGAFVASLDGKLAEIKAPFFDFFVIHQGVIDRVVEHSVERFKSGWSNLKKKVVYLIIDTGMGRAPQAQKERLRSVEYSNLAHAVVEKGCLKYDLVQLLFSLRARPESSMPSE